MENKPIIISSDSNTLHQLDSKVDLQNVLTKMIEGKPNFNYKKLVVPMSMRSIYWKYFGFPANEDGNIISKVKIVCILCKTQIAYNRNTSNLRMHLQNKHAQELYELEAMSPPRKQVLSQEAREKRAQKRLLRAGLNATQHIYTTNSEGTIQIDGDIQFVTEPNLNLTGLEDDITLGPPFKVMIKGEGDSSNFNDQNVTFLMSETNESQQSGIDTKTFWDAVTELLIIDLQSPQIVEEQGFQNLIAVLKSPCGIPSKSTEENDIIPRTYETLRESVEANLASLAGDMSLAIEEWKSSFGESFITISVYHQNPDEPVLECKVLNTLHAPTHWKETDWNTEIDSILVQWNLKVERITAVIIATSRAALISALSNRGLVLVPCLLHTLQICAQACFDNPDVACTIAKCRAIIGVISRYPAISETLTQQEQELQIDENPLLMDYSAVWTSTYNMLEQMVIRRHVLTSIFESAEIASWESLNLNSEQWKIVEDLVTVLEPFKDMIMTLSEEKVPLISLLKPLLWQLVSSHLKTNDSDSEMAHTLKESLSDMLCERYADSDVTLLLQISTTLDPRFKEFPHASEEDKNIVAASIKEMLTKLIQDESEDENNDGKCETELLNSKCKKRAIKLLLGNAYPISVTKSNIPAEQRASQELAQYQSEATALLDDCPLQWWARIIPQYPNLGKLAQKYNCVPACCAPPSRISAEAQVFYDKKRSALPPHLVDKLLFLHGNYNI